MKKYFFDFFYSVCRCAYRLIPLSKSVKEKYAIKIIQLIFKYYPSNNETENGTEYLAYDVMRDRNASRPLQNMLFPMELEESKRVMIFLVPYYNVMSGGIYSIFSIATHAKRMKALHNWDVLVMTLPNSGQVSYLRNRHFINNIDVFRFSQILRLKKAKQLYIHIPEYAAPDFLDELTYEETRFIESMECVYLNILNQNIRLMPTPEEFSALVKKFPMVGQSVAHHAYFGLEFAEKYKLNTMLLPAYTDLSDYLPLPLEKKEKLIIYSPDEASYKSECLSILKTHLPEFEFVEIRDITFDKFMSYASRCLFSITFGEGMDGYFSQPILQGGMSFSVYNDEFFPSKDFLKYQNIFDSHETLLRELPTRINELLSNKDLYQSLNKQLKFVHDTYYKKDEYLQRIEALCNRQYDVLYDNNKGNAYWSKNNLDNVSA